ncbi:hypothetical protein FQN54_008833 [Arachnomyces sp. PD_36]|nr:hypothetical protein FQN54_008833 [Arachnomyces sp. PD_36]
MSGLAQNEALALNGVKRKRDDFNDSEITSGTTIDTTKATAIIPTKTHDGSNGNSNRGKPSPRGRVRSTTASPHQSDGESCRGGGRKKSRSTTPKPPPIPWPDTFKRLSQTHRALNIVYTFCCTRKHFATTFNNIKASVEAQTGGRELKVEDVARVKVLVPRAVRFETVDEEALTVMGAREVRDDYKGYGKHGWEKKGPLMGVDGKVDEEAEGREVLFFEFVDGDLKREGNLNRPGDEDMRMPVFSQKQMMTLIEKRNKKFGEAIDAFLVKCQIDGVDPVERLEKEKDAFIPSADAPRKKGSLPEQIPKERKTISEIVAEIKEMDWYTAQIVPDGHRVFEPQPSIYGELTFSLSQNLVNALYNTRGITQFYSHQAEAINNLYDGHNVIVSTSTSSGKSLIYQVPMLHELEKDPTSRGMYIFPTKALAQDQRRSMMDLLRYMDGLEDTIVETFDGDTPMADRSLLRDEARIIFTNPDMLHITILPQENSWRTFLQNLKFVVVDELHVYNGLFGSHVALIIRRLRRICAAVGNRHVKFISCSATVANPEEHMKTIFGVEKVKLTEVDGSPAGRKEFICWNTPFKDPADPSSGRADSISESARLFCQLILRGVRVIAFCKIRKQCEMLLSAVRTEFQNLRREEVGRLVMGYRGGYNPQDRRRIEKEMFEGKLLGIVATNALELGVDIGSLDAVITHGFPFSISNLRQQSGRAGRRNKDSLSILVGDKYPTDQHYMKNPDEIFTKPNCELQVDLENELVLEGHVQCAAFEMPIRPEEDTVYFGDKLPEVADTRLTKDKFGFYHCNERFRPQPSKHVSIRDANEDHFAVIDTTNNRNAVLEEVETSRAVFSIYEGGIFLHQGATYLVKELNAERHFARVVRVQVDWTTQPRDFVNIDPIETEAMRRVSSTSDCRAFYGAIQIHGLVYGYFKVDKKGRILDAVNVDNPPIEILSKGMWLDVPKRALEILASREMNVAAAIHAAEHAMMGLMPTFIISSPGDIRTECKVPQKELGSKHKRSREEQQQQPQQQQNQQRKQPQNSTTQPKRATRQRPARLTFYDAKGGAAGSGITAKAFEFADLLLRRACDRIDSCTCITPRGCIECVCDERCKELNVVMSKAGAGVVLKCLLGWEVDVDALPWGEELDIDVSSSAAGGGQHGAGEELAAGLETVVEAVEVRGKPGGKVRVYDVDGKIHDSSSEG